MQAAIIAGGKATRLGDLTRDLPKSLLPIGGVPFIDHQLAFLKRGGVEDVVLCLGYLGGPIEEHCGSGKQFGLKIEYSYETEPLDTAGALKKAAPLLQETFFSLYGDSYVTLDFTAMWEALRLSGKMGAMSVYRNDNLCDRSNTAIADGLITEYSKAKWKTLRYIDYGVNLFRRDVLDLIPQSGPYSLGELFQQLIARQELQAYEVAERFYQIGDPAGLQECRDFIESSR